MKRVINQKIAFDIENNKIENEKLDKRFLKKIKNRLQTITQNDQLREKVAEILMHEETS